MPWLKGTSPHSSVHTYICHICSACVNKTALLLYPGNKPVTYPFHCSMLNLRDADVFSEPNGPGNVKARRLRRMANCIPISLLFDSPSPHNSRFIWSFCHQPTIVVMRKLCAVKSISRDIFGCIVCPSLAAVNSEILNSHVAYMEFPECVWMNRKRKLLPTIPFRWWIMNADYIPFWAPAPTRMIAVGVRARMLFPRYPMPNAESRTILSILGVFFLAPLLSCLRRWNIIPMFVGAKSNFDSISLACVTQISLTALHFTSVRSTFSRCCRCFAINLARKQNKQNHSRTSQADEGSDIDGFIGFVSHELQSEYPLSLLVLDEYHGWLHSMAVFIEL